MATYHRQEFKRHEVKVEAVSKIAETGKRLRQEVRTQLSKAARQDVLSRKRQATSICFESFDKVTERKAVAEGFVDFYGLSGSKDRIRDLIQNGRLAQGIRFLREVKWDETNVNERFMLLCALERMCRHDNAEDISTFFAKQGVVQICLDIVSGRAAASGDSMHSSAWGLLSCLSVDLYLCDSAEYLELLVQALKTYAETPILKMPERVRTAGIEALHMLQVQLKNAQQSWSQPLMVACTPPLFTILDRSDDGHEMEQASFCLSRFSTRTDLAAAMSTRDINILLHAATNYDRSNIGIYCLEVVVDASYRLQTFPSELIPKLFAMTRIGQDEKNEAISRLEPVACYAFYALSNIIENEANCAQCMDLAVSFKAVEIGFRLACRLNGLEHEKWLINSAKFPLYFIHNLLLKWRSLSSSAEYFRACMRAMDCAAAHKSPEFVIEVLKLLDILVQRHPMDDDVFDELSDTMDTQASKYAETKEVLVWVERIIKHLEQKKDEDEYTIVI